MSPATRTAVRNFQQRSGLPITGYVGPDTQQALVGTASTDSGMQIEPGSDMTGAAAIQGTDASGAAGGVVVGATPQNPPGEDVDARELLEEYGLPLGEFGLQSEFENWESGVNSASSSGRGHCNCHQPQPYSGTSPGREFEFEWEEEKDKPPKRIDFSPEQVTADMCKYAQTFTVDGYKRGEHKLSPNQQEVLKGITSAIRKRAQNCGPIVRVDLGGHTNTGGNPKIGGGPKYNYDLGLLRAKAMSWELRNVVPPRVINVHSEGGEKPAVYPDPTEREQLKNRRVEIIVW